MTETTYTSAALFVGKDELVQASGNSVSIWTVVVQSPLGPP